MRKSALIILLLLTFISCRIEHGLEPIRSKIEGTIIFEGPWPRVAEEVRVAASPSFPPEDPLEMILSDPLPVEIDTIVNPSTLDTTLVADSVNFVLFLPPGDYHILVLWKKKGSPWDVSSILGVYTSPSDTTKPAVVKVSTSVQGVDIKVSFPGSNITGTITFLGEWPPSTEWVRVVVYKRIPVELIDYYPPNLSAFSDPIPIGVSSYDYTLPIAAGTYEWVLVAWKGEGTSLFDIKEIGTYYSHPDSTNPGKVVVPECETVTGIDITADFSRIGGSLSQVLPDDKTSGGNPILAGQSL